MRAHRSRQRIRRLAHACGLIRRLIRTQYQPTASEINESWGAIIQAGWMFAETPRAFLCKKGFKV